VLAPVGGEIAATVFAGTEGADGADRATCAAGPLALLTAGALPEALADNAWAEVGSTTTFLAGKGSFGVATLG
jgi:hypothetical protein